MQNTNRDMYGKVCLITGANSGIGKATACGLAKMGAIVIMVARNPVKGRAAMKEIRTQSNSNTVDLMLADLSSQAEVRRLAASFIEKHDRLHVLINNAGIIPPKRTVTVDGLETQFAVNHLAPFLLTNLLLDVLKDSAPARVVNVSSTAHRDGKIYFDDLQSERRYIRLGWQQYCNTKLANILFTIMLAQHLEGTGVTANCLHPGVIMTNLWRGFPRFLRSLARLFFDSAENGAQTTLYLATSSEVEQITGKYFVHSKAVEAASQAYDKDAVRRLWQVSAELTGLV